MSDLIDSNQLYHDMTMKRLELHEKGLSWNEFCRGFGFAMEFVKQAPSAEPERKKGRWIYDTERIMGDGRIKRQFHCSVCGYQEIDALSNFCPNCGADMK